MEEFSLPHILAVFKRHRKSFAITYTAFFCATLLFAFNWASYRSIATVGIERPAVSQNITSTGNEDDNAAMIADQRISAIEQDITAQDSLAEIIEKYNLYAARREKTSMANVVEEMRNKIKLDFVTSQISNPIAAQKQTAEQLSAIAFILSFDYSDPIIAQKVNNELVERFMAEDTKMRRERSQETSSFLAVQLKELESSMDEQEKKIADFKTKYGETGPEALLFNQQAANSISLDLQSVQSQIIANERTQGSLRSQLATVDPYSRVVGDGQVLTTPSIQLKALEAQYATLSAKYGPDYPDVAKVHNQIEALRSQVRAGRSSSGGASAQLKAQIADTRANLAAAQSNSGANNPDVAVLKRKLAGLESRLAATSDDIGGDLKNDADNPAYLSLAAQLRATEEEHKSLVSQKVALVSQQTKYQRSLAQNPAVEQQMAALSRDYENLKTRYHQLKEKKMAADMSGQLEQNHKGERLVVINPASLPLGTHPSRKLIALGGFICAFFASIFVVILLEAMNQRIYGQNHLEIVIGTAPMVSIPYIMTDEDHQYKSQAKLYYMAIVIVGAVALTAYNIIRHL